MLLYWYKGGFKMTIFKKIAYVRMLETQRNALTEELACININIKQQEESCSHILVNLGNKGIIDNYERCLICGQQAEEGCVMAFELCVHAEDYLLKYDINDEIQCNEKFDAIQTLAFGLLRENPNMTREELTIKLNNLIQESINIRDTKNNPKLIKK